MQVKQIITYSLEAVADTGFSKGGAGIERHRREDRGAVGVEGGGVSPSPLGVGSGEGAVPPPQKIFGLFILK